MKKILFGCLLAVMALLTAGAVPADKKNLKTVVFATDIDCDHCKKKILNNVPALGKGVEEVEVDVPTKRVTVVYNADKTDEATLIKGFAKLKVKAEAVAPEKEKNQQ